MIVECPANVRLQDWLLSRDIHILTACGGRGNCGKCRVKILKGEAAAYNREMNDRYTAIFSAEAGEPVYLVPILHRPVSLFVRDSMEFEGDRICCSDFFDNDNIYFKVGDLIMR